MTDPEERVRGLPTAVGGLAAFFFLLGLISLSIFLAQNDDWQPVAQPLFGNLDNIDPTVQRRLYVGIRGRHARRKGIKDRHHGYGLALSLQGQRQDDGACRVARRRAGSPDR